LWNKESALYCSLLDDDGILFHEKEGSMQQRAHTHIGWVVVLAATIAACDNPTAPPRPQSEAEQPRQQLDPLPAPGNLHHASDPQNPYANVLLRWDPVPDAEYYQVRRVQELWFVPYDQPFYMNVTPGPWSGPITATELEIPVRYTGFYGDMWMTDGFGSYAGCSYHYQVAAVFVDGMSSSYIPSGDTWMGCDQYPG
jgi:hypothetical protein